MILLAQATFLARRERLQPKQASLRRSVSAAYYALFHLLIESGVRQIARDQPDAVEALVRRAFEHSDMKEVCKQIVDEQKSAKIVQLLSKPINPKIVSVAKAFIDLQNARLTADYDTSQDLERSDVLRLLEKTKDALKEWRFIHTSSDANVFSLAMLLHKRWNRMRS